MATPLVAKTSLDETQASDDDEIRTLYGQDPSTFEDENDFNTPPPPQVDTELPQEDDPLLPSTDFIPADHRLSTRFVTFVFFCLGMATLLPWNFFISVNSFWDYKFRDVNDTGDYFICFCFLLGSNPVTK